jgi:hypothetical protein
VKRPGKLDRNTENAIILLRVLARDKSRVPEGLRGRLGAAIVMALFRAFKKPDESSDPEETRRRIIAAVGEGLLSGLNQAPPRRRN